MSSTRTISSARSCSESKCLFMSGPPTSTASSPSTSTQHADRLVRPRRHVLAHVVRPDGKLPVAAVHEHRELDLPGRPKSISASRAERIVLPVNRTSSTSTTVRPPTSKSMRVSWTSGASSLQADVVAVEGDVEHADGHLGFLDLEDPSWPAAGRGRRPGRRSRRGRGRRRPCCARGSRGRSAWSRSISRSSRMRLMKTKRPAASAAGRECRPSSVFELPSRPLRTGLKGKRFLGRDSGRGGSVAIERRSWARGPTPGSANFPERQAGRHGRNRPGADCRRDRGRRGAVRREEASRRSPAHSASLSRSSRRAASRRQGRARRGRAARAEAAKAEAARTEAARIEAARTEVARTEVAKGEPRSEAPPD